MKKNNKKFEEEAFEAMTKPLDQETAYIFDLERENSDLAWQVQKLKEENKKLREIGTDAMKAHHAGWLAFKKSIEEYIEVCLDDNFVEEEK